MARIGNEWLWKARKVKDQQTIEQAREQVAGTVYREVHYCLRADRVLLRKDVCGFPSHFDTEKVERHDWGWKRYGKVKAECLMTTADKLRDKGFEVEYRS
jgi:hypothetical protein